MRDDQSRPTREEEDRYTVITEREEVRRWADENDVVPVSRGDAGEESPPELARRDELGSEHEEREWDPVLEEFEERELALAYTETEGGVEDHRFVDRTHVDDEHGGLAESVERELLEGGTVETEVTEREVVETEIVEEATIESQIVDSEVVDSEVVGTEIVDEELVDVAIVESADAETVDAADRTSIDDGQGIRIEEEGIVALEIDQTRTETEEQVERQIVESRVVDQDVREETSVEAESIDVDVDVGQIHQHLGESGILNAPEDAVIDEQYVETEFDEDDVATSTLTTHSTVENLIEERKVVLAAVDDVEIEDSRVVSEEVLGTDVVDADTTTIPGGGRNVDARETGASGGTTSEVAAETEGATPPERDRDAVDRDPEITERAMGKSVEMPDGEEIGIVSDVDEDRGVFYVDEDPSVTDRIKAHLEWGDEEDASRLTTDQIEAVRNDAVVVKGSDQL